MGSGYSAGPFPKEVRCLVNLEMVEVRRFMELTDKMINKRYKDDTFMTRGQFQKCFGLTDVATYSLFKRFDPEGNSRVLSLDIWGALILAASCRVEQKLKILFDLVDINEDHYIARLDVERLLRCASRGFSRLKGIQSPEHSLVQKIVFLMFESNQPDLSEIGEISTFTFREFFQICELLQTYMANLGTQATAIDIQKLIGQRAELMKEISEVESDIEQIKLAQTIADEDADAFASERGGDSRLLILGEDLEEPKELTLEDIKREYETRQSVKAMADRDAQRQRRMERAMANGQVYTEIDEAPVTADDAEAFTREDRRSGVGAASGAGNSEGATLRSLIQYEGLLEFRWKSFSPQSADKRVQLDIDKIEDLFESVGIRLTDEEAACCLESLHPNQIGRHSLQEVLAWFQARHWNEMVNGPPRVTDPPPLLYTQVGTKLKENIMNVYNKICSVADILKRQRRVSDGIKLLDLRRHGRPGLLQLEESVESNSFCSSVLLGAWQRRRQPEDFSKIIFSVEFGKDVEEKEEEVEQVAATVVSPKIPIGNKSRPAKPGAVSEVKSSSPKQSKLDSLKNAMKSISEGSNDWKFQVQFHAQTSIEEPPSINGDKGLLDAHDCLRIHPALFTASQITDHFKISRAEHELAVKGPITMPTETEQKKDTPNGTTKTSQAAPNVNKSDKEKKKKKSDDFVNCKSAIWFSFMCKKDMSYEQAEITRESLHRTFEGIPYDYRCNIYRYTKTQVFPLPPEAVRNGPNYLGSNCVPPISNYSYVILAALIHDDDVFRVLEEKFCASNIAISRALVNLSVELNLRQDISEVIAHSRQFDGFESRLFGPQEEEIGEEGMNPIRFAKACRKKRQELEEASEAANKLGVVELKQVLKELGLNNKDTERSILLDRVQREYKHKLNIVGSGDLSEFGRSVVGRIFDRFDEDQDGGLSLTEMNNLLLAVGCATIASVKEYKMIMSSNDFYCDDNDYLTKSGLCTYYERFGRLATDITALGMGSMDEVLQGELNFNLTYDPEAVNTMMPLLEKHTLTQVYFKKILNCFATLHDLAWDAKVNKISEVFELFRDFGLDQYLQYLCGGSDDFTRLQYLTTMPGMFSHLVDSFSEWLADGERGLIREMKLAVAEKVPKFSFYEYDWDKVFDKVIHRMLVSFGNEHDDVPTEDGVAVEASENGEEGDDGNDGGTDTDGKSEDGEENEKLESEKEDEKSISTRISSLSNLGADKSCFRGYLPQVIATTLLGREMRSMLTDAKNAILALQGAIRVTRKQREALMRSQREWERGALLCARLLKQSVKEWPVHASAFYDCLRVFPLDFCGVGFGTPEFGCKISFKGFSISSLNLPKGDGSPCPVRKLYMDKIYRSLQRKAAAVAAIERQKERARLAKEKAEREAREELERQRRSLDPQILFDEEESAMIVSVSRALDDLRQKYLIKKESAEAERREKEAELIRLGLMDAEESKDNQSDSVGIDGSSVSSGLNLQPKLMPSPVYIYKAYLPEARLKEFSPVLQLWYDIMELRESRYRLKPLKILKIVVCQNNIAMLLIEYYIQFRKSDASQRRLTEARTLLSLLADTVHEWLSREAGIDLAEAKELAEVEARSKAKGGDKRSRASTATSNNKEGEKASDQNSEGVETVLNEIIDGKFPEERDVALPELRKRGLSAAPFIILLQNYVSFIRRTIALPTYFVPSKAASRIGSAVFSPESRSASPSRAGSLGSFVTESGSAKVVNMEGAEVMLISQESASESDKFPFEKSNGNRKLSTRGSGLVISNDEVSEERTEFVDYQDYISYLEDNNTDSLYLRTQTRIHGLISQLTEKEAEDIVIKKTRLELSPLYVLPFNFYEVVSDEMPLIALKKQTATTTSDETDDILKKEDELHLAAIALAIHYHGDGHNDVAEKHFEFGKVLAAREGYEEKAIYHFEAGLAIQRKNAGNLSIAVAETIHTLAKLHKRKGDMNGALAAYYAVLERYAHIIGKDCPEIAEVVKDIGNLYHEMGRRDACHLMLKQSRLIDKAFRQASNVKNKVTHVFIDMYSELAQLLAGANITSEADKLFKSCIKLSSRYMGNRGSLKYSKQYSKMLEFQSRLPSPEATPSVSKNNSLKIPDHLLSRSASTPTISGKEQPLLKQESTLQENEDIEDEKIPLLWKELNMTSDEVILRRELRDRQRSLEKERLRAIAEEEEAERKRQRDLLETPEMLAAAAKKARLEAIRRKREKAEAMRKQSTLRRTRLYEMIKNDQISTYFKAVSNSSNDHSSFLQWDNQDAQGIVDPFADLDGQSSDLGGSPSPAVTVSSRPATAEMLRTEEVDQRKNDNK